MKYWVGCGCAVTDHPAGKHPANPLEYADSPTTQAGRRMVAEFIEGGTDHYAVNDIARDIAAIEREAALPEPSLDADATENFAGSGYCPGCRVAIDLHPEDDDLTIRCPTPREAVDGILARLRGTEGSHRDRCPVEGCDELPEDHRHIGPTEELLEKARLVSQWHGAMNSGPLEVLDAELGELGEVVARVKSNG